MAPAALLTMHDMGIPHHFPGNPRSGHPHYYCITATVGTITIYFTSFTEDFPQLPQYYHYPHYHVGLWGQPVGKPLL